MVRVFTTDLKREAKVIKKKNVLILGLIFSFVFICLGGTYAYFTASTTDDNTISGNAATVSFALSIEKVTTIDMAYGLIPMRNEMAPYAASHKCRDDFNNAGCQMYKITITADSETTMFLDGYIVTKRKEGVETRISEVISNDGVAFSTRYTKEDFDDPTFIESEYIKTGERGSSEEMAFNHEEDYNCLFIKAQQIGGDFGKTRIFYMMIWVYDNGQNQDYMQGMQQAYTGEVTFQTAQGNEITATFD